MKKSFLTMVVLFFFFGSLYAQNVSDFDIQVQDNGTVIIMNYKGPGGEITVPEHIFNMPVVEIKGGERSWGSWSEGAFTNKRLTKVTILAKITIIEPNTFSSNQITSVTLPDTLEYISDYAFANNRLTSITIPENVEYIGNHAFHGNQISSITIPEKVVVIGNSAFSSNPIRQFITIPNSVSVIGSSAFYGSYGWNDNNRITNITLGNSVKFIGEHAFHGHRASSLVIPDSIGFIGNEAFSGNNNSLNRITIGRYVWTGNNVFGENFPYQWRRSGVYSFANNRWTFTPND